jgi:hypothetical protein
MWVRRVFNILTIVLTVLLSLLLLFNVITYVKRTGVPCILVGDSMGMTMLGYDTTLPVKMEETLSATAAVARAVKDALVVADMPFGSYQCGDDAAMANAVACLKAGADAVKLEGGARVCGLIRRMTEAGIPVVAHVGMTPQSVNAYGGFKTQGKTREAAAQVLPAPAKAITGRVASGDVFVEDTALKQRLIADMGAAAAEMEGAAIAQTASENGVPFLILRTISDLAEQKAHISFDELEVYAGQLAGDVTTALLERLDNT